MKFYIHYKEVKYLVKYEFCSTACIFRIQLLYDKVRPQKLNKAAIQFDTEKDKLGRAFRRKTRANENPAFD